MEFANPTGAIIASLNQSPMDNPVSRQSRVTKSGRHLHYEISVIQQPQKARACGSGPKSSADRRPVDPPPVLQFFIYEGDTPETRRDVTFDYNADFFVYASLELARPMAHPRGQSPQPPVLCGFPVAGCCYFDRPTPAAYFVFPDLSVRHEGYYRLVFSVYEQIKNPTDEDEGSREEDGQGFYHRLELRSGEFNVFSAKKFPGLSESTNLSRTVAEQGCRVRIRRDVRMRRREGKNASGDKPDDDASRRSNNRSPDGIRARSASNSSTDHPFGNQARRISNTEFAAPPPWGVVKGNALDFGGHNAASGFIPPSLPASSASHPVSPMPYGSSPRGSVYPPPSPYMKEPYTPTSSVPDMEVKRQSSIGVTTPSHKTIMPAIAPKPPVFTPVSLPPLAANEDHMRHNSFIAPRPDHLHHKALYDPVIAMGMKRQAEPTFEDMPHRRNIQGGRHNVVRYNEDTAKVRKADGSIMHVPGLLQ